MPLSHNSRSCFALRPASACRLCTAGQRFLRPNRVVLAGGPWNQAPSWSLLAPQITAAGLWSTTPPLPSSRALTPAACAREKASSQSCRAPGRQPAAATPALTCAHPKHLNRRSARCYGQPPSCASPTKGTGETDWPSSHGAAPEGLRGRNCNSHQRSARAPRLRGMVGVISGRIE